MPIFFRDNIRILYIHVPKTGGTAVEFFFAANGFGTAYLDRGNEPGNLNPVRVCSPQHMESAILSRVFRLSAFDYVFMTVRHPLARFVSEYNMRRSEGVALPEINRSVKQLLSRYKDDPYLLDNHIRPQSEFWVPGCDVFKQEDGFGPRWVDSLSRRVQSEFSSRHLETPMKFDSGGASVVDLDEESVALLRAFYREDLNKFAYP